MCEGAKAVVVVLQTIQKDGPQHDCVGICYNVDLTARRLGLLEAEDYFQTHGLDAIRVWVDAAYTGCAFYPIEDEFSSNLWGDHYAGRARRRLLKHLIQYFQDLAEGGTPDAG